MALTFGGVICVILKSIVNVRCGLIRTTKRINRGGAPSCSEGGSPTHPPHAVGTAPRVAPKGAQKKHKWAVIKLYKNKRVVRVK